ncbi:MAG: NAD(P)H-hydrate dehydratase [Clostridia bacterium]|nr:NAD(P)H-hydrate dehydratase [Clostridia bacterium]
MQRYLTNSQMRSADNYTINTLGVPSETLMRRAGLAIAEEVLAVADGKTILVVCGTGNNGGDGYVCSQILLQKGVNVSVYAMQGRLSADCEREKLRYTGGYSTQICGDIIVDCLFGTGLCREVGGEYAEVINKINASGAYVISADIPSGINGDNGLKMNVAVKANLTVAIAEYKLGFILGDGMDYCGKVIKKDIGICLNEDTFAEVFEGEDIAEFYPARPRNSHKGTFGTATLICGCTKYVGAAVLATEAALRSGCGYVKLDCSAAVKRTVAPALPQTVFSKSDNLKSDAIAIGMGSGVSKSLYEKISYLLKNYTGTLIIDADGLNTLSKYGVNILKGKKCGVILTPHAKEFSRLTGIEVKQILSSPVEYAQKFSSEYGVTLLLKGAASVICGDGKTYINTTGCTALAKAGSGDMLSGYMCGVAARGVKPLYAAVCSQYMLGLAAEIAAEKSNEYTAIAGDILQNLSEAVTRTIKYKN